MSIKKVLIVDDDQDVLDSIKDLISLEEKYCIETASGVLSAKETLNKFIPDIALLDISLGDGTGLELVSFIKNVSSDTDCIMMTAHRDVDNAVEALRVGASEYLFKPVEPELLLETLDVFFHQREVKQEERNKQQNLKQMALHDPLTGLANRVLLAEHMKKIFARARRNKMKFSVIFVDLDNFKKINDSFGHQVGDELLKKISASLIKCVRDEDMVSRIGGDEFIVILSSKSSADSTRIVLERITESVNAIVNETSYSDVVSASLGVALFPDDGMDTDTLISNADKAMYIAKEKGKNRYQYFSDI